MNRYALGIAIAVFGALALAVSIGLKYSQTTFLFGLVAAISAPIAIHKVPNKNIAVGMLVGLSAFASYPLRKLFQIDYFTNEFIVILVYLAILWVIAFGWRRIWL